MWSQTFSVPFVFIYIYRSRTRLYKCNCLILLCRVSTATSKRVYLHQNKENKHFFETMWFRKFHTPCDSFRIDFNSFIFFRRDSKPYFPRAEYDELRTLHTLHRNQLRHAKKAHPWTWTLVNGKMLTFHPILSAPIDSCDCKFYSIFFFPFVHWWSPCWNFRFYWRHVFWGRRTRSLGFVSPEFGVLCKNIKMYQIERCNSRSTHNIRGNGVCVCVCVSNSTFKFEIFAVFFLDLWIFPHLIVY